MHNSPWDSPTGIHRNPLRGYCNFTELTFSFNAENVTTETFSELHFQLRRKKYFRVQPLFF